MTHLLPKIVTPVTRASKPQRIKVKHIVQDQIFKTRQAKSEVIGKTSMQRARTNEWGEIRWEGRGENL